MLIVIEVLTREEVTDWYVQNQDIDEFIVPEGVEKIAPDTFLEMDMIKKIKFPSTLKQLERGSLEWCGAEYYSVDENCENFSSADGIIFTKNLDTVIAVPPKMKNIYIPKQVKEIMLENLNLNYCAEDITVDEENQHFKDIDGVLTDKEEKIIYRVPPMIKRKALVIENAYQICKNAFDNCENIETLQFSKDNVIFRGFMGICTKLRNIICSQNTRSRIKKALPEGGRFINFIELSSMFDSENIDACVAMLKANENNAALNRSSLLGPAGFETIKEEYKMFSREYGIFEKFFNDIPSDMAISAIEKTMELSKGNANCEQLSNMYRKRAECFMELGEKDNISLSSAISDFNRAEMLTFREDIKRSIMFSRAKAYGIAGDLDNALREYDKIIGLYGENEDIYLKRAELYIRLRRYEEAGNEYNTLAKKYDNKYYKLQSIVYRIVAEEASKNSKTEESDTDKHKVKEKITANEITEGSSERFKENVSGELPHKITEGSKQK